MCVRSIIEFLHEHFILQSFRWKSHWFFVYDHMQGTDGGWAMAWNVPLCMYCGVRFGIMPHGMICEHYMCFDDKFHTLQFRLQYLRRDRLLYYCFRQCRLPHIPNIPMYVCVWVVKRANGGAMAKQTTLSTVTVWTGRLVWLLLVG